MGRSVPLIPCTGQAVVRLVTGLAMVCELRGDELGKGLVTWAGAGVSDGPNQKSQRYRDRVDPASMAKSLTYRWIGRLFHCGPLKFLNESSWGRSTAHRRCEAAPGNSESTTLGTHQACCKRRARVVAVLELD